MLKKISVGAGVLIGLGLGYLALWPVGMEPAAWDAPINRGYVGAFAPNTDLANLERLSIGDIHGPEDIAIKDGIAYISSQNGKIITIDLATKAVSDFAQTGGVPLGLEFDEAGNLIIADAHKGLLSAAPDGTVTVLTDAVDGTPIAYADDLDIAEDGVIYVSDASTRFGAADSESTMSASLFEIMEHRESGRLLAYNPADKSTRVVASGFTFANGVAMHPDGDVLMNETGKYNVWKINPASGTKTEFIGNMPGFPDNINRGPKDANGRATFILGLISVRSDWLDENASKPGARKVAMRLPAFMRPSAVSYGHIVHLAEDGSVIRTWQDPSGDYIDATGGIIHDGYLTSPACMRRIWAEKKLN